MKFLCLVKNWLLRKNLVRLVQLDVGDGKQMTVIGLSRPVSIKKDLFTEWGSNLDHAEEDAVHNGGDGFRQEDRSNQQRVDGGTIVKIPNVNE